MKKRLLITVFGSLLFGTALLPPALGAAPRHPEQPVFNEEALVYIMVLGLALPDSNAVSGCAFQYRGLRMGFAVGDGRYIATAAHCIADIKNSATAYFCPLIISRYCGDIVAAEVVAVDEPNDIAILKPAWDIHPALELDTGGRWRMAPKILMAAYPPPDKKRGGNGHLSSSVLTETARRVKNPDNVKDKIIVGPIRYPGPGWSGSPFIVPETNKVAGLLAREAYGKRWFKKYRLTMGPDASVIRRLFEKNAIDWDASDILIPDGSGKDRFQHIVSFWDSLTDDPNQDIKRITGLCTALPESPVLNSLGGIILSDPNDSLYHGRRATELAPQNAFARLAYGTLLSRKTKTCRKAAAEFGHAAKLEPDNRFAHHLHLKMLADTDPNAAVALGQELTTRWPEEPDLWFEYAHALRNQNKRSEELPLIQKAVTLAPSGKVPFLHQRHLADALAANEKNEAAEQAYETLLKTHQCSHCWNTYADFLEKIHKPDQAARARRNAKTDTNTP